MNIRINKQFQLIFAVAFFIPLIRQINNALPLLLIRMSYEVGGYFLLLLFDYLFIVINAIITPILLFALFYYIGKKPYINFEMRPILLALLIGNIVSSLFGPIIYLAIEVRTVSLIQIILQSMLTYFVVDFLVALAGLSMGYIKQKKLTSIAEPQIS